MHIVSPAFGICIADSKVALLGLWVFLRKLVSKYLEVEMEMRGTSLGSSDKHQ